MSAETDYRAALVANASLVALVSSRIAQNALPQGAGVPCVVFSASRDPELTLSGGGDDRYTFSTECWAKTADEADEVADEVEAAIETFDTASTSTSATVLARQSAYDPDVGLNATVLTVEWWP